MRGEEKPKGQLIGELADMRQRIAELEAAEAERVRAEEALRESEERFRNIFENAPIGIYRTTPDGRILAANPALVRMLGCSSFEELAQRNLEGEGYHPNYPRSEFKQRVESEGQIIGLEAAWVGKDGSTLFIRENARAVRGENGKTLYYEGTVEDITERARAEEALRESEEKYRSLIEQSGDALYLLYENRFEIINPRFTELFGITPEEANAPDFDFMALVAPRSRPLVEERVRKLAEGQELSPIYEFVAQDKGGNEIEVEVSVSRVSYRGGTATQGILRDITARVQAEEALRRRSLEQRALREAALVMTTALERDEVIERILAQLQKVVPYDSSTVQLFKTDPDRLEIVGGRGFPNLPDLLGLTFALGGENPNTEVVRTQASVIVDDAPAVYGDFHRQPHAQVDIHSWLGVPMLVGERLVGMIALDKHEPGFYTQEQAQLAEAFAAQAAIAVENAQLYEQARRDAAARAVLLREVNHRVKNNLTGIIGLLYTARSHARVEDRATYQATIDDLIGRVRGLATVHGMLSASEGSPLRLSDVAAQVIRAAQQALPYSKRVAVDVSPSPVRVTPDEAHDLALVINELATNVVKHALGDRDAARVTFRVSADDGAVRCEFRDDGPGYPAGVLRLERHNVGFDLIQNIVRYGLRGELSLHNDRGAVAVIRFQAGLEMKGEEGE